MRSCPAGASCDQCYAGDRTRAAAVNREASSTWRCSWPQGVQLEHTHSEWYVRLSACAAGCQRDQAPSERTRRRRHSLPLPLLGATEWQCALRLDVDCPGLLEASACLGGAHRCSSLVPLRNALPVTVRSCHELIAIARPRTCCWIVQALGSANHWSVSSWISMLLSASVPWCYP